MVPAPRVLSPLVLIHFLNLFGLFPVDLANNSVLKFLHLTNFAKFIDVFNPFLDICSLDW
jgi:hypothetical protein